MKPKNRSIEPESINWKEIEAQVYALKAPGPPEQKLKKAKVLAAIYQKYGKRLPNELAILV